MAEHSHRTVAIVGRPNVGKSALFNRLCRKQIALVFDRPGTTRDRLVTTCRWNDHEFTLIDTGGLGLEKSDGFGEAIAREADLATAAATDIILVVDARAGLLPLDREVAQRLRKSGKPVLVAANKMDDPKKLAHMETDFAQLGFGNPIPISAVHGHGIDPLLFALTRNWPKPIPKADTTDTVPIVRPTRVAIVGKPNVGKSSLINALINDNRTIVSPIAGTTRDAVDVSFSWQGHPYTLIDTAGLRQKSHVDDELEAVMTGRSVHSINRADVCLLVIDASTGVTMQDKKIAARIQEARCPCLIVVNKWDIARQQGDAGKKREREYYDNVMHDLFFLSYAPVMFLSAKTGERLDGLMRHIQAISRTRHFRFSTGVLNRVLQQAMIRQVPPSIGGRRFKILYATQQPSPNADAREIPTLVLFVNSQKLLTEPYRRYLELQLREKFKLTGCPIQFILRDRAPEKQSVGGKSRRTPKNSSKK
jgi:GTP-binding protein